MRIGLIDVDGHNYPNLPLMKLSAWHKQQGDHVEWYLPLISGHMDKVYMSKVFSFSPDYEFPIDANEVIKGGSGYAIHLVDGKEVYDKTKDKPLPPEIEHIYPDYSIYNITDTAYGFLTRGCPRQCDFCHVKSKEGIRSHKVADLNEFWAGQENIVLCDANILACCEWKDLLQQLIDSKATVDFNQGLDIRLITEQKAEMLNKIKVKTLHFAWDKYSDKDIIVPKLKMFAEKTRIQNRKMIVYCLCNFDTSIEEDFDRIYTLRNLGYSPYIMIYDKEHLPKGHVLFKIARWCNNHILFWKIKTFEEYKHE